VLIGDAWPVDEHVWPSTGRRKDSRCHESCRSMEEDDGRGITGQVSSAA
jgi:hypothetical protein